MNWYVDVLKLKYAEFNGRAHRQEFWMFFLVNFIILVVLNVIDRILGQYGFLGAIYSLAVLVPGLAVGARRLHDTDRSGWWLLIYLTCIGAIILIVWWAQDSQPGSNQYGPNPKGAS